MDEQAPSAPARRGHGGPDRLTVALFSMAAFLVVLALLGAGLNLGSGHAAARKSVLVRRIYKTTVVEKVLPAGAGGAGGTSVSQSVSGASSAPPLPATPVTRTS